MGSSTSIAYNTASLKAQSPILQRPLKISVVTPCLNQRNYLEPTIRSVLDQQYPTLDYCVMDGGSTDGSWDTVRQYGERLARSRSGKDQGQYDAINAAFAESDGDILAWLNADDLYMPWTFAVVSEVMRAFPHIQWLTSRFHLFLDKSGTPSRCEVHRGFSSRQILRGGTLPGCGWPASAFIQQESTFWRRSLWERAGAKLNWEEFRLAADFELWMRFAKITEIYYLDMPLAGFRVHEGQKTSKYMETYLSEAKQAFAFHGGRPPNKLLGWSLKSSGRLLRYLRRLHAFASLEQGPANHVFRNNRSGEWEMRHH